MHRAGGYLLSERIAPLWIGEFGIGTGSLAGFSGAVGQLRSLAHQNDVDWCWWALNHTQPRGTVPVVGRHRSRWGDGEGFGLLAPDWRGVAIPQVLDILRAMIPPRTPGVS